MAIISAATDSHGLDFDGPVGFLGTNRSPLVLLHADATDQSDSSDPGELMGGEGALADGSNYDAVAGDIKIVKVPSYARFLDLMLLVTDAATSYPSIDTAPVIQVYGCVPQFMGRSLDKSDLVPSASLSNLPTEARQDNLSLHWWIPLVDKDDEVEITMGTTLYSKGRQTSSDLRWALTAPQYVKVSGCTHVAVTIATAAALTGTSEEAAIVGSFTS